MMQDNLNIITYHPCKSTGFGGVEGLIRNIQSLSIGEKYNFVEVYNDIYGNEVCQQYNHVDYQKLVSGQRGSWILKIKERLAVYSYFSNANYSGQLIIIFHPEHLLLLPRKTLINNKIILIQTNKFEQLFQRFGRLSFRLFSNYIDVLSVYTKYDYNFIENNHKNIVERTVVIPRGCKISTGIPKIALDYKLVTICRIDENQKNLSGMIKIVENLPPKYTLDIYGIGPENEIVQLKKTISSSRVRYMGECTDVKTTLQKYNLFLMTSHYEGFGQTLIEARSQGLPIVAYDTFDALKWIVKHDFNGKIVDYEDNEEFAESIKKLLSDESSYLEYSMNSISMAKDTESDTISRLLKDMIEIG
ncbi:glycosyltransferase [Vibrio sp. 1567]|uniref:glycosyltransferase n=1 Tax=Vibrio sp. 1567 TaxID=3074564 RepID=UPI0029640318|nr:glycosyltransferase [Vibrio sp. 1567]MDW2169810.1 glycosyltransferase [Vibrio sp. 1567]